MTKDELIDKLDNEIAVLKRNTISWRESGFDQDIIAKTDFRNAIYNMPLSDFLTGILFETEDLLHEMYMSAKFEPITNDNIYDLIGSYFEKVEREKLSDVLYKKADAELTAFREKLCTLTPDEIIENSYELVVKQDIVACFEYGNYFSTERLRALSSLESPLSTIYKDWLRNDFSIIDDIRTTIEKTADERVPDASTESFESTMDCEDEDEFEL